MWIEILLGPPDTIMDVGTKLIATELVENLHQLSIKFEEAPIKVHHSIFKAVKYRGKLKLSYEILEIGLRNVLAEYIFQMIVKVIKDTAGPEELIPTLLVFGAYLRMTQASPQFTSLT